MFARHGALIAILAAALALTAVVASLPVYTLVGVVPDDAFYYLTISRNLANTGVSTFDGENLASGFHPAWMMLETTVARWLPDKIALLRVMVAVSLLLHATAGWLLYLCLRRAVGNTAAAAAVGVWMFGRLPLLVASFALESSLYCVAFLLGYLLYLQRIEPYLRERSATNQDRMPTRNLLLFGAALGLCVWARTEAIVLVACAAAWLAVAALRRDGLAASLREACRRGALTTAAAFVAFTPWLLFSLHSFGTIRQASGVMKTLWRQDEIAKLGVGERVLEDGGRLGQWLAYVMPWAWSSKTLLSAAVAMLWVGLFLAAAVHVKRCPADARQTVVRALRSVAYPLLHVLAAGVVYSTCFTDVQCWYLALPCLEVYLAIVVVGGAICRVEADRQRVQSWTKRALAVALVFTALGLVRYGLTFQKGFWAWQRDVYASLGRVAELTPAEAKIGCFNAGVPSYFGQRRVVNLDGLVNDAVVPYWRSKTFSRYLADAEIAFVFDDARSLERAGRFSQGFPAMKAIAQHPLTYCISDTQYLWELTPSRESRKPR
jgi:hypothetical protein